MTSVFDVRRQNLRKLIQQWGGPTVLAQKLGHSNGSYLAQLAGPHPSRDVSEKVARDIERRLSLPMNWMDSPHRGEPGQPDANLLIEVVAVVQDLLEAERVRLSKPVFQELATLVYERATELGRIDPGYARRLIQLTK